MSRFACRLVPMLVTMLLGIATTIVGESLYYKVTTGCSLTASMPTYAFDGFTMVEGEKYVVFRLTNNTCSVLSFAGYGGSVPEEWHQIKTAEGWQTDSRPMCGVGLREDYLLPGQSVTMQMRAGSPWRPSIMEYHPTSAEMAQWTPAQRVMNAAIKKEDVPARIGSPLTWKSTNRHFFLWSASSDGEAQQAGVPVPE